MKTKLVLDGTNGQDERILLAIALQAEENKVDIYSFADNIATEDFTQKLMNDWRNGKEVEFPEHAHIERELSVTEGILPDDIKVKRTDVIQRAQTEWHFVVLSNKLHKVYQAELGEMKEKVAGLESYSKDVWNSLKEFWGKVQDQSRERNLFREHADELRDETNALFSQMKEMRSKADSEMKEKSKAVYDKFMESLSEIEDKIEKDARFQSVFAELRDLQRKFRDSKLVREHGNKVYARLDKAFKTIKSKRFGDEGNSGAKTDNSALGRLQSRMNGLLSAIDRMEKGIKRDKDDLAFQGRRIANSDGQLEAQIRQAKVKMIEDRIASKQVKLDDMYRTKTELEGKMEKQKERDAKNAERKEREKAKAAAAAAAKEKIQAEMAAAAAAREGNSEELEKAAEEIAKAKAKKEAATQAKQEALSETSTTDEAEPASPEAEAPKEEAPAAEESVLSAVSNVVGDSLEDVVDTVKAVAAVMSDKIEDAVEELKDKVMGDEEEE